jgi:hypothetical protein
MLVISSAAARPAPEWERAVTVVAPAFIILQKLSPAAVNYRPGTLRSPGGRAEDTIPSGTAA